MEAKNYDFQDWTQVTPTHRVKQIFPNKTIVEWWIKKSLSQIIGLLRGGVQGEGVP